MRAQRVVWPAEAQHQVELGRSCQTHVQGVNSLLLSLWCPIVWGGGMV